MTQNETFELNTFERLMRKGANGVEYWFARELMPMLGYVDWRNFYAAIERAKQSIINCDLNPDRHIHVFSREITIGRGRKIPQDDVILTRYGCYIVAMNGDPFKREIALAQRFFAEQTRKAELLQNKINKLGLSSQDVNVALELFIAAKEGQNIDAKSLLMITEAMNKG
jgi:DNA-damage-inducible protein D